MLAVIFVGSITVGRHFDLGRIGAVFYKPIEHQWFLAYLFLYFMLAVALSRLNPVIPAVTFYVVCWLPLGRQWQDFWYLVAFFMLGVAAVKYRTKWEGLTKSLPLSAGLAVVSLAVFTLVALCSGSPDSPGVRSVGMRGD